MVLTKALHFLILTIDLSFAWMPTHPFCVTGSADHGLRVWDLEKYNLKAELFGKKFGHNEWVTCCAFAMDNAVVSGGMDGKICIWDTQKLCAPRSLSACTIKPKEGVRPKAKSIPISQERIKKCKASTNSTSCKEIQAHSASISALSIDLNSSIGVSSSYDACLSIWNVCSAQCEAILKDGHVSPILKFCWAKSLLCSADKGGSLCIWDLNTTQPVLKLRNVHDGPVGDVCLHSNSMNESFVFSKSATIITAGQKDGTVAISDTRLSKSTVSKRQVHGGAINKILFLGCSNQFLCTMSADSKCKLFDFASSGTQWFLQPLASVSVSDAIFCGTKIAQMGVVVGTGDGKLNPIYFENQDSGEGRGTTLHGRTHWTYDCETVGAVHAIKSIKKNADSFNASGIIAGGDSGHLSYLKF